MKFILFNIKLINFICLILIFSFNAYAEDPYRAMAKMNMDIVTDALKEIKDVPPLPENWKEIVENGICRILKDPESARFRYPDENQKYCVLSNLQTGPMKPITLDPASPLLGYSGIVFVNAKNSFGGYTGETPYWYMITDGKLSLIREVKTHTDGIMASLFTPINSIKDIENSSVRWENNYFKCIE